MSANVYYDPEKFGLRIVGEAEFSSGSYEFDTSIVWQDVETGAMFYADDAGCSCPIPFDSLGRDDLTRINRLQDLIDYLDERKRDSYRYDLNSEWSKDDVTAIDGECADLIQKYREARR